MSRTAPRFVSALLLTSTVLGSAALGNVLRHSWPSVPQASYYEGTVQEGGVVRRIRTSENWALFPGAAEVKLDAYDRRGRRIGPAEVKATAPSANLAPSPPVASEPDEDLEQLAADDGADEAPKIAPAPQPVDDPLQPPAPSEPSVKNLDFIALLFAAGRETVESVAGVSKFQGEAGIGGTVLAGRHQQARSTWFCDALLAAHNFTTEVKEAAVEGDVSVGKPQFLRLFVRAGAFYDFLYKDERKLLAAGAGLLYTRLPGLELSDVTTKEAELVNVDALGPYLAAQYQSILSGGHALSILALYEPLVLDPGTNGKAFAWQAGWRYMVAAPMFVELGLQQRREAVNVDIDCSAVADCTKKSETRADTTQALVGFGYKF